MYPDLETLGNLDTCLRSLSASRAELLALLDTIDDAALTASPSVDIWSPALIAEHIAISEGSAAKVVRFLRSAGQRSIPSRPVEQGRRTADGRAIAPEVVSPHGGLTRQEVMARLAESRGQLEQQVGLSREVIDALPTFPHPFLGELTALGWLRLMSWHEPHHIEQMRRTTGLQPTRLSTTPATE